MPTHTLWTVSVFALVVLLAAGLRVWLVPMHFPVIESNLETYRFLHTLETRPDARELSELYGSPSTFNRDNNYEGYPPIQLWLHAHVQRMVEARTLFPFPNDYILAARYASVVAGVLATALLAWMGWYLASPLGVLPAFLSGLAVSLVWALAPAVITVGSLALIDPLLFPYIPLMIICAVYAIRQDAPFAAVLTLVFFILALYTKYVLAYAVGLVAVPIAVLLWRRGSQAADGRNPVQVLWRGVLVLLPWIAMMAVLSVAALYWLIVVNDAFALQNYEARLFYAEGGQNAFSLNRNLANITSVMALTTGIAPYVIGLVLGAGAFAYCRRRALPTIEWWVPALILLYVLPGFVLISSVRVFGDVSFARYTLSPMIGLLAIWGLALGQLALAVQDALSARRVRFTGTIATVIVVALLAPMLVSATQGNLENARAYAAPRIEARIWAWSDATLSAPEGKIMMESKAPSWVKLLYSRVLTGYDGNTPFDFIHVVDISAQGTPETFYHELDIAYWVATQSDLDRLDLHEFTSSLALLKTFDDRAVTGDIAYFYRMLPPQHTADATYGDRIQLAGYDLSELAAPGGEIALRPFWQVSEAPGGNYSMFVHLRPADDSTHTITQHDGAPAAPGRLTPTWTDPDELIVGAQAVLTVPDDAAPGDYVLWMGLYDFQTGARLPLADGTDSYPIPVTITTDAEQEQG